MLKRGVWGEVALILWLGLMFASGGVLEASNWISRGAILALVCVASWAVISIYLATKAFAVYLASYCAGEDGEDEQDSPESGDMLMAGFDNDLEHDVFDEKTEVPVVELVTARDIAERVANRILAKYVGQLSDDNRRKVVMNTVRDIVDEELGFSPNGMGDIAD
jgi:hypothetical protein